MNYALSVIVLFALAGPGARAQDESADKKISYRDAKLACLKGDASLKGHPLRKCIYEKRRLASK